ncbi:MAG TPA: peptidoglycan DD-metalloendopeptidase family protein [Actinomycetota bacterium]
MRGVGRPNAFVAVALAVAATVALVPSPAAAYHSERQQELQQLIADKQHDIARLNAREQNLLAQLNESNAREARLRDLLLSAQAQLAVARRELAELVKRVDLVQVQLSQNRRELDQALADLELQGDILDARVAQLYTSAPSSYSRMFTVAESFTDLIDAEEFAAAIVQSDRELIDSIEAQKVLIEQRQAEIETRLAALEQDRKAARATTQEVALLEGQREQAWRRIATEVAFQKRLLAELQSKEARFKKALAAMERESNQIAAFLQGAQAGQSVIQGKGGWLKWPVSGYISSGYGYRTHPIYGYRSFHTGIDIAAPSGATVRAARKGTVLDTGYMGAYGLTVIMGHGNGIATVYAHLSQVYVSPGEHVSTLESIAAVGSTGWSTGPHLHFEVRVNGQHTNPMQWL